LFAKLSLINSCAPSLLISAFRIALFIKTKTFNCFSFSCDNVFIISEFMSTVLFFIASSPLEEGWGEDSYSSIIQSIHTSTLKSRLFTRL